MHKKRDNYQVVVSLSTVTEEISKHLVEDLERIIELNNSIMRN